MFVHHSAGQVYTHAYKERKRSIAQQSPGYSDAQPDSLSAKEVTKTEQYVLITNRRSKYYKWMQEFMANEYDSSYYEGARMTIAYLQKEQGRCIKKFDRMGLPQNWRSMLKIGEKIYPYFHEGWDRRVQINDSGVVEYMMDSPQFFPIDSFYRINGRHYGVCYNGSMTIDIFMVDHKKGIAVFKYDYRSDTRSKRYELMVDAQKVKNFPIVTHPSTGNKMRPLHSDRVDFEGMIEGRK
jgi:hypothetical protein